MNKNWVSYLIQTVESDVMLFFTFYFSIHGHPFAAVGAFALAVGSGASDRFKEIE